MKITKNSTIQAASTEPSSDVNKYAEGIQHIRAAIDALGAVAMGDELAKDAIANLSVVLLDLQ